MSGKLYIIDVIYTGFTSSTPPLCLVRESPHDVKLDGLAPSGSLWVCPDGKDGRLYGKISPNSEGQRGRKTPQRACSSHSEDRNHPPGTWVLSVSAAPLPSGGTPVLVLVLSRFASGVLEPVCPGAASSTPVLPRAHPWQCGSPRFIVAMGRVAGEAQRHAGVWRRRGGSQSTSCFQNLCWKSFLYHRWRYRWAGSPVHRPGSVYAFWASCVLLQDSCCCPWTWGCSVSVPSGLKSSCKFNTEGLVVLSSSDLCPKICLNIMIA